MLQKSSDDLRIAASIAGKLVQGRVSAYPEQTSKAQKPGEKIERLQPVFIEHNFEEDFLTDTVI